MNIDAITDRDRAFLSEQFAKHGAVKLLQAYECALIEAQKHGHYRDWCNALNALPESFVKTIKCNHPSVTLVPENTLSSELLNRLTNICQQFLPWRKGPFNLLGVNIDTEWRSDMKWARLEGFVDFRAKRILDVGCGNGYYAWRMLGDGAQAVLGVDPYLLFWFQYLIFSHFIQSQAMAILPMTLEALPTDIEPFDIVLSMGVLYHRRSPIEHLDRLRHHLRPGGHLVLETLVIDGDETACLCPEKTYANMPNVWFLPSCALLERWLQRCKFVEVEKVDDTVTSVEEQRSTPWMPYHSLIDALDEENLANTVEGYPAPRRVVYLARRK